MMVMKIVMPVTMLARGVLALQGCGKRAAAGGVRLAKGKGQPQGKGCGAWPGAVLRPRWERLDHARDARLMQGIRISALSQHPLTHPTELFTAEREKEPVVV